MLVRRGVAAGDVAADAADTEVNPRATDAQTVLAAGELLGGVDLNLIKVGAGGHAPSVAGLARATSP